MKLLQLLNMRVWREVSRNGQDITFTHMLQDEFGLSEITMVTNRHTINQMILKGLWVIKL